MLSGMGEINLHMVVECRILVTKKRVNGNLNGVTQIET